VLGDKRELRWELLLDQHMASWWERQLELRMDCRWDRRRACEWVLPLGNRTGTTWERKCVLGAMSVFPWEHRKENLLVFRGLVCELALQMWAQVLGCPWVNQLAQQ